MTNNNDVPDLLAKRMSRRQFLFGNRAKDELPIIPVTIGLAGVGVGVLGLGSPGPSSTAFTDAFIRKFPPTKQSIKVPPDGTYALGIGVGGGPDALIFGLGTLTFQGANLESGSEALMNIVDLTRNIEYDGVVAYTGVGRQFILGMFESNDNTLDKLMTFRANSGLFGGSNWGFTVESESGVDTSSGLLSAGAQVGLPTSSTGAIPQGMALGNHRHPFSGRFTLPTAFFPVAAGAGFPLNQQIVQYATNWTLRRLWVRCTTGPVGGTETYAVVNAAGVVQGTGVVLAAGGLEVIGALQVTNLVANTKYYLAQTAVGAGWAAGSTNTHLTGEYTMNA